MKALLKVALPLVACSLVLAGCGADPAPKPQKKAVEVKKDAKANLSLAIWDEAQLPVVKETVDLFNKQYPNIKVEVTLIPEKDYWMKLRTDSASKKLPDVFWMNGANIQLYARNGQLEPLDDLVKNKKLEINNFPKGLKELYTVDKHLYGVPKDFTTIAIFYNRELFEKAGVPVPKEGWTWADYMETCKQLKEKLEGVWPMVAPYEADGQQTYYNTVAQAGGYIIKDGKSGFADPKTIKGVQFWSDLVKKGYLANSATQNTSSARGIFQSAQAAMYWAGSWEYQAMVADGVDFNKFAVASLPKDKQQASTIYGQAWVVSESSKQKDVAKVFAAFAGTKQAQELQTKVPNVIPAYNGAAEQWAKSAPESANLKAFLLAAQKFSVPYPVSIDTAAWNRRLADVIVPAINKGENVASACKKMATIINEALKKENE